MDKRVIFGLLTLAVVGGVGYYLYRESKKTEGGTLRKGVDEVKVNKPTKQRVSEMQKQLAKTIDAQRDSQKQAPQVFVDDNPEGRLNR